MGYDPVELDWVKWRSPPRDDGWRLLPLTALLALDEVETTFASDRLMSNVLLAGISLEPATATRIRVVVGDPDPDLVRTAFEAMGETYPALIQGGGIIDRYVRIIDSTCGGRLNIDPPIVLMENIRISVAVGAQAGVPETRFGLWGWELLQPQVDELLAAAREGGNAYDKAVGRLRHAP